MTDGSEATQRGAEEIAHGRRLSLGDPESAWGWGTPAGQLRARRRAALIASRAGFEPGRRVLEVGCGTGVFTELFAAHGVELTAVEISADLLARARSRNLPNVRFLARRFEDCELEGPFEAVVGSSVAHHLDVPGSFRRMHELLAPGGRIAFAEPNYLNPQIFLERHLRFVKPLFWYVSPEETAFLRWPLASQLRQAGFEDVAIVPFDWLHPRTPEPLIPAVSAVGRALEVTPLLRELAGSLLITARRPPAATEPGERGRPPPGRVPSRG